VTALTVLGPTCAVYSSFVNRNAVFVADVQRKHDLWLVSTSVIWQRVLSPCYCDQKHSSKHWPIANFEDKTTEKRDFFRKKTNINRTVRRESPSRVAQSQTWQSYASWLFEAVIKVNDVESKFSKVACGCKETTRLTTKTRRWCRKWYSLVAVVQLAVFQEGISFYGVWIPRKQLHVCWRTMTKIKKRDKNTYFCQQSEYL